MSARPRTAPDPHDFEHKKSLGQNFLTSDIVPGWLCDAGMVEAADTVIEIGPGTGALTRALLARGARVIAVETDARAMLVLTNTFAEEVRTGQLTLIHADMRDFDLLSILPPNTPYKVVANIPYYLSGFLLRTTLELTTPPTTLVFLMQKEVVERICRDKKSSILALSVAVYGTPRYIKTVSRGHFQPPPKVDSAILQVTHISHEALPSPEDRTAFFSLLHTGLGSRRKQLLGLLTAYANRETLMSLFSELALAPTVRGEDLPLATWLTLYKKLKNLHL